MGRKRTNYSPEEEVAMKVNEQVRQKSHTDSHTEAKRT